MNDGRKVDKTLYKDILLDFANDQGIDTSNVTDDYVNSAWEGTGGDPTKLMKTLAKSIGFPEGSVNDKYMEKLYDNYDVIDPKYMKSTYGYFTPDERKLFLPENADERQEFRLETSLGALDDYYKSQGELTPFQKERMFSSRVQRRIDEAGGTNNEINDYAKRLASNLGMVYDPERKTYVVPGEERAKYQLLLNETYLDPNEVERMNPTISDLRKRNEEIASIAKANVEATWQKEKEEYKKATRNPIAYMDNLAMAGEAIATGQYKESLYIDKMLSDNTREALDLAEKLESSSGLSNMGTGLKAGLSDYISNIAKLSSNLARDGKVNQINNKIGNIYEDVMSRHPEWRYRDHPVYSDGEMLPPDSAAEIAVKQGYINEEVSRLIDEQLSPSEINVLNAFQLNIKAQQEVEKATGTSFRVGSGMGQSLGFMIEFALTGGLAGLGKTAIKEGVTLASKKAMASSLVKSLSNTKVVDKAIGIGGKIVSSKAANVATKAVEKVAGTRVGKSAGNFSAWAAKNSSNAASRTLLSPTFMANVANDITNGVDVKTAVFNNFGDLFVENFSEGLFMPAKPLNTVKESMTKSALRRGLDQIMYRGGFAGYGQRGFTGWIKGMAEEMLEEKFGDVVRGSWTAIDRGESEYLTREFIKPDDLEMVYSIALMSTGLSGSGWIANKARKAPPRTEEIRFRANKYGKMIPSELRERIDNLIADGELTVDTKVEDATNEINGAINGLYDEFTAGGEKVKEQKDLATNALNYFKNAVELDLRDHLTGLQDAMSDANFQAEGERFMYQGKEVQATDTTVQEEGKVEVEDAGGNRVIVDYNDLTPIQEEVKSEDKEVEQDKINQDASETREVRSESEGTEQQVREESEPVGGVSEVNGTESTQEQQEEKVSQTPTLDKLPMQLAKDYYEKYKDEGIAPKELAWEEVKKSDEWKSLTKEEKKMAEEEFNDNHEEIFGDEVTPYIRETPYKINKKPVTTKEATARLRNKVRQLGIGAYRKGAGDLTSRLKKIRGVIREGQNLLTPAQYRKIMSKLAGGIKTQAKYQNLVNEVERMINEQQQKATLEERGNDVKKAKQAVRRSNMTKAKKQQLLDFLDTPTDNMTPGDLDMFNNVVADMQDGRFSELTEYLVDIYKVEDGEGKNKLTPESVERFLQNVDKRISKMSNELDEASFKDMNRYLRSINNIRNKAFRLYENDQISENDLQSISEKIDNFMTGEKGFENMNQKVRDNVEEMVGMELEDAYQMYPMGTSPLSVTVSSILSNAEYIPTLTNFQLNRLYNALYNLNNGYITRELVQAQEDLARHDMFESFKNEIDPKLDALVNSGKMEKWRDRAYKLQKALDIRDLNTAEYMLWDNYSTPIYDNIVTKYIEPATIQAHVAQARMLKPWASALEEFSKYYVLPVGVLNTRGRTMMDLAGMLMIENNYQKNDLVGKEGVSKLNHSWFLTVKNDIANRDAVETRRINNATELFVLNEDGSVNIDKTIDALPARDAKAVRTLINAARQIFDGELRDMNIASAAFRGYDTGFDQVDYAPRQSTGGSTDIQAIETIQEMANENWGGQLPAAHAIHSRRGGIHKVNFDIASMVTRSIEEATMEFNVVHPYNAVVKAFKDRMNRPGTNKDEKMILNAYVNTIKDRIISTYHLDNFHNRTNNNWNKFNKYISSAARTALLVNPAKMATEIVTNVGGAIISDGISVNPVTMVKNIQQQQAMRDMYEFYSVPDAEMMSKYSELTRDAYGNKTGKNAKMIDAWIRFPDLITSSNMYIKIFNNRFKELNGSELDIDRWQKDDKYRRDITKDFRNAHRDAMKRTQESFNTVAPVSQASKTRLLPWSKNISRDEVLGRWVGFMMSYSIKEVEMMKVGWGRMVEGANQNNSKMFLDGLGMLTSRFTRSIAYNLTKPLIGAYLASLAFGGDDDDSVWDVMQERTLKSGAIGLAGIFLGRYGTVADMAASFILGGVKFAEQIGAIEQETYEGITNIAGWATYARPQNPYNIKLGELFEEVLPAIGIFMNAIGDNASMAWKIYDRAEHNEPLTDSEEEFLRACGAFFELMTFIVPNVFTANLRTILKDGANYKRRQEANKERESNTRKAFKSSGLAF